MLSSGFLGRGVQPEVGETGAELGSGHGRRRRAGSGAAGVRPAECGPGIVRGGRPSPSPAARGPYLRKASARAAVEPL